jgi:creatinine amidohydrolase
MEWQAFSTHVHSERKFEAALLPVGTLEAHDSAPVGTDNYIPECFCQRLSERLDLPRLPLMPYGVTSSLLAYPGGCTVSDDVLSGWLFGVGKSLYRNGLRQLIVINGHGGNTGPLRSAASQLFSEVGLYVAVIDWWYETTALAESVFGEGGMGHSGIDELGALYGLCPQFQAEMKAEPVPSYHLYRGTKVYPAPRPVLTRRNRDDVVDLSRLTPEVMEQFVAGATDILTEMITTIRDGWNEIGKP